jgi:hypothetical protein
MLCAIVLAAMPQEVALRPGLVITGSVQVKRGSYLVPNSTEDGTTGAIVIKGDGITVDFNGATLRGTPETTQPDERAGTGVYIEGKNVTVKDLNVHGYKMGVVAKNAPGLRLLDCDFSYNWKQHLKSTVEREDSSDWMSYHQNEKDEWLRYGAGAYLRACDGFEVRGCRAEGGQNGLMLTECDDGLVWNNDFSFLSSLGIGMYRSSGNRIMHNRVDWCVRGYSHGVYNRGQDSAGILIYEQSNDNVFAYNSVTHGGDGFFLWAGQTTMDTGKGGCNGNLLFGNDFSHAPTNGIEATFSKNTFVNNLILECWHGIWGGYSWETRVIGNTFGLNAEGIAWEHGQDNQIVYNTFDRDRMAINVWQKDSEDPNWGYAKLRDTRSRNNLVAYNTFRDIVGPVVRTSRTFDLHVLNNLEGNKFFLPVWYARPGGLQEDDLVIGPQYAPPATPMDGSGNLRPSAEKSGAEYLAQFQVGWSPFVSQASSTLNDVVRPWAPKPLDGGIDPFLKPGELRGRKYILVDEWGPYDFKYPVLWPRSVVNVGREQRGGSVMEQKFEILGPKGKWKVLQTRGVSGVSAYSGTVPGTITARIEGGQAGDVLIELQYTGGETHDYRGVRTAAGKPVKFSYSRFVVPIDWTVKWFRYDAATQDPRTSRDYVGLMAGIPLLTQKATELNYAWGGSPGQGVPNDRFLTLAEGSLTIAPGQYEIEVTSDDGVRVFLDGKVVLEDWTWHAPKTETVVVKLGGAHRLRVEHFELDGYAALKVLIKRKA